MRLRMRREPRSIRTATIRRFGIPGRTMEAVLSVDHPFYMWHDLKACYIGNGWQVKSVKLAHTDKGAYEVAELYHPEHGSGRLYYTLVDGDSRFLPPPGEEPRDIWEDHLRRFRPPAPAEPAYQVQVLLRGWGNLPPAQVADAESLFFRAAELFSEKLPQLKGGRP